ECFRQSSSSCHRSPNLLFFSVHRRYPTPTGIQQPNYLPTGSHPFTLLQSISMDLLPLITFFINGSLSSGHVPQAFKAARVVPLLRKPSLDTSDISSYRPDQLQDINQSDFKPAQLKLPSLQAHQYWTHCMEVEATQLLVQSLVMSRLDCCNLLLAGLSLPGHQALATGPTGLIFNLPKFTHFNPLLRSLHRLPVATQFRYNSLMLAYKAKNGPASSYFIAM
ncbi:hypothetical protein NFI96_033394, partial [Prochilodus magdalenae]